MDADPSQIGWYEGAEALLDREADPNLGNRNGMTPLMYAVQRADIPMIRLLRQHDADPDQTDNVSGYSALDYARQSRRPDALLRELD